MAHYEVIVGNIGSVYTGGFIDSARVKFAVYVAQSQSNIGRAGGESVTIMRDGEIFKEYIGERDSQADE